MLSDDNYVDIHALKRPGMTITEIDRRTDNDRKAIRSYLARERLPGVPQRADPDSFEMFVTPVTARLTEHRHLWGTTILEELRPLGFTSSYPTLTRQVRDRKLRPACTGCMHLTKRPNAIIEHPPGKETQFDWVELPDTPAGWPFVTKRSYALVGSIAHPRVCEVISGGRVMS